MSLLQSMSTRGKLLLAASVLAIAVVGFMLVTLATKPTYTTLGAGLDPAQTGKLTGALDSQGIAYKLANGGTAIEVPSADVAKARVALAGSGLSATGGSNDSWANFDKQKLGSSTSQQQVAYQRALEGQIAQTVGQVAGVSSATVQLTMPQDQLFADQQKPATASVLVNGEVEPAAVKGIANLVASAVPNLKSSSVRREARAGDLVPLPAVRRRDRRALGARQPRRRGGRAARRGAPLGRRDPRALPHGAALPQAVVQLRHRAPGGRRAARVQRARRLPGVRRGAGGRAGVRREAPPGLLALPRPRVRLNTGRTATRSGTDCLSAGHALCPRSRRAHPRDHGERRRGVVRCARQREPGLRHRAEPGREDDAARPAWPQGQDAAGQPAGRTA